MQFKRFLASMIVLAGMALGQTKGTPDITPAQQAPITAAQQQLPFFFPKGIYPTTQPLQQRKEYEHIFQASWACNQGNQGGMQQLIPGSDSISVTTDVVSTDSVTENPSHMKIVIDHAYRMADGRIRYTSMCDQYFITQEQLDVVVNGLKQEAISAAAADNAFYQVIAEKAISARAVKLGIKREELVSQLDEKVPGYSITFRELHRLPKLSKASDFIPRELHLGYNPPLGGILGVTWLNTGVIYFNPEAWMTDYVLTKPVIMQHEMVHGNINFEKFPMSEAFDVELMADMPMTFYPENTINFQNHGYNADLREFAEIYFGFDWDQYHQDTEKMDFAGNLVYDDANYMFYYNQIATIKAEMLKFYMDVAIPEFYSDPVWWSAANNIRGDNNSVFRMMMSDHYNPTLLGGAAKTMDWLESHREEIKEVGDRAFKKGLGGDSSGTMSDMTSANIPPYFVDQYQRMFTETERAKIQEYFQQHPEKLKEVMSMSPAEALQFLGTFKSTSKGLVK